MSEALELQVGTVEEETETGQRHCKALNVHGERCGSWAMVNADYCFHHNPEASEERKAAWALGGATNQAKHSSRVNPGHIPDKIRTIDDLLALLDYCKDELLMLRNGLSRNKAIVGLVEAYIKIIEKGEFQDHVGTLEGKVDELKDLVERAKDPRRYR